MRAANLAVQCAGVPMRNPVMPASGCFGWGREYSRYYPLRTLGSVVAKAVTKEARPGNDTPRIAETPGGMLNAIGLANPGLERVLADELPWLAGQDVPVWVNVAGSDEEEYCMVAAAIDASGMADVLELNVSCPNVKRGGLAFGTEPSILKGLVTAVRRVTDLPLFVKLTPNVTDAGVLAEAAVAAGADGLTVMNTLRGMAIDLDRRCPVLANGQGGLSGPAVKPVALAMVYQLARTVDVPIIGCGGIQSGTDAVEFIMAGADAVQVGTANFTDPYAMPRIIAEMQTWMERSGAASIAEIKGAVH